MCSRKCNKCETTVTNESEGMLLGKALHWHEKLGAPTPNDLLFFRVTMTAQMNKIRDYVCLCCSDQMVKDYINKHRASNVLSIPGYDEIRDLLLEALGNPHKLPGAGQKRKRTPPKVGFGKHKKLNYEQLLSKHPDYCDWIESLDTKNPKMKKLQRWLAFRKKTKNV